MIMSIDDFTFGVGLGGDHRGGIAEAMKRGWVVDFDEEFCDLEQAFKNIKHDLWAITVNVPEANVRVVEKLATYDPYDLNDSGRPAPRRKIKSYEIL